MKFEESSLPNIYSQKCADIAGLEVDPKRSGAYISTMIYAMSDFLGSNKSKENKTAVAVKDTKGNLLMAAIVEYHENEDEKEMPGNWSYEMTFDDADLAGANVFLSSDPQYQLAYANSGTRLYNMELANPMYIQSLCSMACLSFMDWCEESAKEKEETTLEFDGYFVLTTAIEDGEKVKSIVPDGAMKKLIKNDEALEK